MGVPQHTPGPWRISVPCAVLIGANGDVVTEITDVRARDLPLIQSSPDMYDALGRVMIGGNHLASILVNRVGPDFAERFPPEMEPEQALRILCATDQYDVWCCWREIMLARASLIKARGEAC